MRPSSPATSKNGSRGKGKGRVSVFHYAGKGVAKGQAETPVLWYRPKDSTTYRVIDADLTVRDVAEADLPTVPSKVLGGATAPAADQLPQP